VLAAVLAVALARAQPPLPEPLAPPNPLPPPGKEETLPPPRPEPATETTVPWYSEYPLEPISLPAAIRLTTSNNLQIAIAREQIEQARANLERARVLALPNANFSTTYVYHEGRIQQAVGNILNTNRDSLWIAAGPSLNFQLTDAIFAPLAARQIVRASEANFQRVTNDSLLAVAEAYIAILRARRSYARVVETLDFLASDQPSPLRGNSKGLLPLVRDIVEVGGRDAFRSDLERVRVEVFRRRDEAVRALQDLRVASAELARLLHLDATISLVPIEDFRFPVPVPGEEWFQQGVDELAAFALRNRPELAENQALVQAALDRWRQAKWRPLLPSLVVNYYAGGFGGGPNFVEREPGTGLGITRQLGPTHVVDFFGHRNDFDVGVVWRLNNAGFGNQAEIREQKAIYRQTQLRQLWLQDTVIAQVVQAHEQLVRSLERVRITRDALFDERGQPNGPVYLSLRLNFDRVRGAEGRPLEVQDSIRGLNDVLEQYAMALSDYDRARFRLLIALGLPPSALVDPALVPSPAELACPPAAAAPPAAAPP
jgi:outer membrane protein TolC